MSFSRQNPLSRTTSRPVCQKERIRRRRRPTVFPFSSNSSLGKCDGQSFPSYLHCKKNPGVAATCPMVFITKLPGFLQNYHESWAWGSTKPLWHGLVNVYVCSRWEKCHHIFIPLVDHFSNMPKLIWLLRRVWKVSALLIASICQLDMSQESFMGQPNSLLSFDQNSRRFSPASNRLSNNQIPRKRRNSS